MTDKHDTSQSANHLPGLDEAEFAHDLDDSTILAQVHSPAPAPENASPESPKPGRSESETSGSTGGSAPAGSQPPWVGRILGHFQLQRPLGQGAMGMVVQAQDINLRRIVALKILRKRIRGVDEQASIQQFLREARAAAQLEHPNVVRVYEINQHRGWWYIAYELIEGGNLKSIIKTIGPLPPHRACPMIADAAAALAAAHDAGIIHRDIKPSNLMLARTGRCKIMDFGLVRLADPADPVDFTDKSVGTPQYMPPEIIQRQSPTPASDIYCLGATLYFALTGEPPFSGKTVHEIIQHHLRTPAPNLLDKAPACSPILARLVARMLAKNPADRPTASEIAAALRTESVASSVDPQTDNMSTGSFIALATGERAGSSSTPQRAGSSPTPASTGSTVGLSNSPMSSESFIHELRSARRLAWVYALIAATLASLIVAVIFFFLYGGPPHSTGDEDEPVWPGKPVEFHSSFPEAPESYGVTRAPSGDESGPATPPIPAFSWSRHIQPDGAAYVAARQGRYFYSRDDPRAQLITPEQFTGYATKNQALAAGKLPAP
ncbi:MAG: serine/threonine-protein kinase [Phycisphaerales bacterium]